MSRIDEALKRAGLSRPPVPGEDPPAVPPDPPPAEPQQASAEAAARPDEGEPRLDEGEPRLDEGGPSDDSAASFEIPGPGLARPPSSLYEPYDGLVDEKIVVHPDSSPTAVEQYRRLAALLHHTQQDRGLHTVMVASALAEEGKTLTAINLALTLSESYRRRVLLIDADLRRPSVAECFGLMNLPGLAEALQAEEDAKLDIVHLSPRLSILPAGQPMSDPMHALTSNRMRRIVEEASEAFDWVVLDSPPVALLTDANLMAAMVEGAILVVGAGSTPFASIQKAIGAIGRDRILGVILNRVHHSGTGDYYDRYYPAYPERNGNGESWMSHLFKGRRGE